MIVQAGQDAAWTPGMLAQPEDMNYCPPYLCSISINQQTFKETLF